MRRDSQLLHAVRWMSLLSLAAGVLCGCGKKAGAPVLVKTTTGAVSKAESKGNETIWATNSVFEVGRNAKDPFFPNKKVSAAPAALSPEIKVAMVRLRGISGPAGHRLALINNQTFAVGEQAKVRVADGAQALVRCLEIGERSVKVQIEGESAPKELQISSRP